MSKKLLRKTPAQPEKRRQKKRLNVSTHSADGIPSADWLPRKDADFIAWGQAAQRAHVELQAAFRLYQQSKGNIKLRQNWESGCVLFRYTLAHAYPADFWEGIDTLLAGTSANLEPYLAFLEADLHFFRSGYAKTRIIRGLKRIALTSAQKSRLQNVVLRVIDKGYRTEFRDYCRLARAIQSPDWLQEVEMRLASSDPNLAVRAKWILEACRKK